MPPQRRTVFGNLPPTVRRLLRPVALWLMLCCAGGLVVAGCTSGQSATPTNTAAAGAGTGATPRVVETPNLAAGTGPPGAAATPGASGTPGTPAASGTGTPGAVTTGIPGPGGTRAPTSPTATRAALSGQTVNVTDRANIQGLAVDASGVEHVGRERYVEARPGFEFVIVNFGVQNNGNQPFFASSLAQFSLADDSNQTFDLVILPSRTPLDGKIDPGQSLRGFLAYQVPVQAKGLQLTFRPDLRTNTVVFVKLDR